MWIETGAPSIVQNEGLLELFRSHVNGEECCFCHGPSNASNTCWPRFYLVLLIIAIAMASVFLLCQAFYVGKRFGYDPLPVYCLRHKNKGEKTALQDGNSSPPPPPPPPPPS